MGIKDRFGVVSMPRGQAIEWLKYKHYAKSTPGIMYTFGLYESRVLIGVCAYGTPANNHNNVLGNYKCIELVRLVVNDGLEKMYLVILYPIHSNYFLDQ